MDNETQNYQTQTEENNNDSSANNKTFTQDEVNRIIKDRLTRERNKSSGGSEYQDREKQLTQRENSLACKEFISENELPKELLEILDTSDLESFKQKANSLTKLFSSKTSKIVTTTGTSTKNSINGEDMIRKAFNL